jgi:hypothetical protein
MTLRAAKWTATLTRATQTLRICLDDPPTYAVAGSMGVDALACARACISLVRGEWLGSQTAPLAQFELLSIHNLCLLGGARPTPCDLFINTLTELQAKRQRSARETGRQVEWPYRVAGKASTLGAGSDIPKSAY